jgi:hypothetical protein
MTTSSQTLPQGLSTLASETPAEESVLAKLRYVLASWRCELHGHSPNLCVEHDRLFLYCSECQLQSPGWRLEGPTPRLRQAGAADRFVRYRWLAASSALQARLESFDMAGV